MQRTIAIIGGGFSGITIALNLIKKASARNPFNIVIIEKSGQFAQGVAYSTRDPFHFLNVRANRMGALADDEEHFYTWLQNNPTKWKSEFPHLAIEPTSFVPRRVYALYLESLLSQLTDEAKQKQIGVTLLCGEATDIFPIEGNLLKIEMKSHAPLLAHAAVLATSLPQYRCFETSSDLPKGSYEENVWDPSPQSILAMPDLSHLGAATSIAVIGSGLTMVDVIVSLYKKGFRGKITVLSKDAIPPEPHLEQALPKMKPVFLSDNAKDIRSILRTIRRSIKEAQEAGHDWRCVIDSLRPITVSVWTKLPFVEKKRFMRHLFSHWNRLRHRIPPQSYDILKQLQMQGRLTYVSMNVTKIAKSKRPNKLCSMGDGNFEADYILNCSGAHKDIQKVPNPFLQNLLKRGLIQSNALNMGIDVDAQFRVMGNPSVPIYALGQLLLGQRLESVAVPELRQQCACIADAILSTLQAF